MHKLWGVLCACGLAWLGTGVALTQEPIVIHVNFLVVDDGVTQLTANATFDGPTDPVGEISPLLPELFDLNILIILNQIYSQCEISFQLETVKVLRPERFESPLRPGQPLDGVFVGQGRGRALDLDRSPSFLDELALLTLERAGEADPFGLFRAGAYLTMFVVGAPLVSEGEPVALAVGQLNGRHSVATYRDFADINSPVSVETIAHEWGHNLGLVHTDEDGLPETDDDPGNLMFAGVNPTGRGNRRLTPSQCQIVRNSPLVRPRPADRSGVLRVPEAFATVQEAVNAAAPGATVELAAGQYDESVYVDKSLNLVAAPGAEVVLRGDPRLNLEALIIDNAVDVRVEGLTIRGGGVFVRNGLDVVFRDNRVVEGATDGLVVTNSRVHLEDNVLSGNEGAGVVLFDSVDSVIRGNALSENTGEFGAGIVLVGSQRIRLEANTVRANGDGVLLFGSQAALVDNVIEGNENFGLFLDEASTLTLCQGNRIRDPVSEGVPAGCTAGP